MSLPALSLSWHHYLAVVTLLDQLDLKEFNWERISVILFAQLAPVSPTEFLDLFGGTKSNMEFSRIVSKFLMDRDRAGLLWVSPQTYVNLVTQILKILHAK